MNTSVNHSHSIYNGYESSQISKSPSDQTELIYSSPDELGVKPTKQHDNKYAVKVIMEKYDSLRNLNYQIDNLQISATDSKDSLLKVPLDGSSQHEDDEDEESEELEQSDFAQDGELSEQDIIQVEVFFRSHKTYVFVCQCLANLYFATVDTSNRPSDWELARTGIPVLLLDKGETRARNKRMLQIVLAEKGSGFVLWRDVIDNLTNYRAQDNTFHTMYLSSDHRRMAGLSYDIAEAAENFLSQVEQLTADPLNICLSVPKHKKNKIPKALKKKEKQKQPRKCDISQPCCFEHVTSVALDDKKKLFSMATLVSPGERKVSG